MSGTAIYDDSDNINSESQGGGIYSGENYRTTTIGSEGIAIRDINGVPELAANITALEVTNLLNVGIRTILDNGDGTYTVVTTTGTSFTITEGNEQDPRLFTQGTEPSTNNPNGSIWINTAPNPHEIYLLNASASRWELHETDENSSVQVFFTATIDSTGTATNVENVSIVIANNHTHYTALQSDDVTFFTGGDIGTLDVPTFINRIEIQGFPFTPLVPAWLPLSDPGYITSVPTANASVPIFFRIVFNPDGSIQEILEASTRLNEEIDPGATEFTPLPANALHTHYATVELNNTRYFSDGTLISFDLSAGAKAHFDGDIIRDDITYTPLVPGWLPLTDPMYVDASGAQMALDISSSGNILTYTDRDGMVQTFAGGLGLNYLTASSIPTIPQDLVADQAYHMRVTNLTATDLPTANRLTIDSNIINAAELDISRGVEAGDTNYFTWTPTQQTINTITNNFGSRTALDVVLRFGTIDVTINDDVIDRLENNTTYNLNATDSTVTGGVDISLTGSDMSTDDVTIVGGTDIAVVRNGEQIRLNYTGPTERGVPSGTTLPPISSSTAGDSFILLSSGDLDGYYYFDGTQWDKDDTVQDDRPTVYFLPDNTRNINILPGDYVVENNEVYQYTGTVLNDAGTRTPGPMLAVTMGSTVPDDTLAEDFLTRNTDTNTTYTFANGTNGTFTVTPDGGAPQTVSVGASGGGQYTQGDGITVDNTAETISVRLANNSGLSFDSGGLQADPAMVLRGLSSSDTTDFASPTDGVIQLNEGRDLDLTVSSDSILFSSIVAQPWSASSGYQTGSIVSAGTGDARQLFISLRVQNAQGSGLTPETTNPLSATQPTDGNWNEFRDPGKQDVIDYVSTIVDNGVQADGTREYTATLNPLSGVTSTVSWRTGGSVGPPHANLATAFAISPTSIQLPILGVQQVTGTPTATIRDAGAMDTVNSITITSAHSTLRDDSIVIRNTGTQATNNTFTWSAMPGDTGSVLFTCTYTVNYTIDGVTMDSSFNRTASLNYIEASVPFWTGTLTTTQLANIAGLTDAQITAALTELSDFTSPFTREYTGSGGNLHPALYIPQANVVTQVRADGFILTFESQNEPVAARTLYVTQDPLSDGPHSVTWRTS